MALSNKELLDRLNAAREVANKSAETTQRMTGELSTNQRALSEIEEQVKTDFQLSVDDLPALLEQLNRDGEAALLKAEKILATPGTAKDALPAAPTVAALPAAPVRGPKSAIKAKADSNDDVI